MASSGYIVEIWRGELSTSHAAEQLSSRANASTVALQAFDVLSCVIRDRVVEMDSRLRGPYLIGPNQKIGILIRVGNRLGSEWVSATLKRWSGQVRPRRQVAQVAQLAHI